MLLAITVMLGFYRLQITEYLRIGFDPLAKELTAMLFGPVAGCAVAGLADIISYIMKPIGAFFPGLTLSAMAGSVIYGVILYRKPLSLGRVILANGLVTVFINLLLNTYWMTVLYGDAFMVLFPARAAEAGADVSHRCDPVLHRGKASWQDGSSGRDPQDHRIRRA